MENIPLPNAVSITPGAAKHTATVTVEPLYPGYGTTVGNALRRVLLSSLPGAALTSFSVKGVQHEFTSLPGVKEDFVEIALNLKQVRLKIFGNEPVRLHLSAKGEGKVTAGQITSSSDAEVVSTDLVIATLTDEKASLELDFIAKPGRGYEPTEAHEKEELEVGMIALDALYSPIRKVGFQIENVRVGQMTNWDKLILEIETDGTVTPQEAATLAGQYLVEQLGFVVDRFQAESGSPMETPVTSATDAAVSPDVTGVESIASAVSDEAEADKPASKKSKKSDPETS